jgi:spermidine synthase
MPRPVAAALVFLSSAAVLVLEILAARLLAPYVGVTLETYTAIIGVVLAGIAVGSWLGGRAADRGDAAALLAPLLIAGGVLAFVAIPVVDGLGSGLRGAGPATTTVLTTLAFFAPAAVLTAVTPAVITLQLRDLEETGRVVGRLSAIGTAGAIIGTFVTGFVLVAALPTRPVIRATGLLLIALGVATAIGLRRRERLTVGAAAVVLVAGALSFAASHPCAYESAYYCPYIEEEGSGRALWLDTLRHSYVDLDDPSHLEFTYTQWFGDVITAVAPDAGPLTTLHIGGGGFTMPRYLRAVHPGSTSTVLELDPLLVALSERELGLVRADDLLVVTGDARRSIGTVRDQRFDLVIGDAFGGIAVPWHLATAEFAGQIHELLEPGGVYTMNVVDYGPRAFLRAELATLQAVFVNVAVVGRPGSLGPPEPDTGGNYVVMASDAPLPLVGFHDANRRRGNRDEVLTGAELTRFIADAPVLRDDKAPVDQLLTPYPWGS